MGQKNSVIILEKINEYEDQKNAYYLLTYDL